MFTWPEEVVGEELEEMGKWELYVEGFLNDNEAGVGLMLISLEVTKFTTR